MLLAVETVGRSATAVLVGDQGEEIAFGDCQGRETEAALVPLLDQLLRHAGRPRALAWSAGPGSFTGLRIGAIALRTLAWMEELPVHAVDSLAALAAEQGDGLWWALMPLKRDTTFHGLYRVTAGRLETLMASTAQNDQSLPLLHALTAQAVAIGPALAHKGGLAERWCPGIALGSPATLSARGVARLAPQVEALPWNRVLPAYLQASAPELQRAERLLRDAALAVPPAGRG
jgi:tRNA threonylcarbamoyl adenosine modification protein YeaZ